jgi:acyl-CoA thioester hydrolase
MQESSSTPSVHTPWYGHPLRVRYQETDRMGVVFHGNYVTWFEVGRTEWIRALGISYRQLEEQGLLLPVVDLNIRYGRPAKYDDTIMVYTRLKEMSRIRMTFYTMVTYLSEEAQDQWISSPWVKEPLGEKLVEGETTLAWVNSDWRPTRFDREQPEIWSMLQKLI